MRRYRESGPLSKNQREALDAVTLPSWDEYWFRRRGGRASSRHQQGVLASGYRNTMASLKARGLVEWDEPTGWWKRTPAGDALVES